MRWSYLGQIDYEAALRLQRRLRDAVAAGTAPDTLLLLEHEPVITLGRKAGEANVLAPPEELERRGVRLVRASRGGDVTYHGPGQLVGYPVRRVDRAVREHVAGMAGALVSVLAELGVRAWWSDQQPGLWTEGGKIAAVGVDARGGVAMHGFALNVTADLRGFSLIVPCGYRAPVTSVRALRGSEAELPDMAWLARRVAGELSRRYGSEPAEVVPAVLRGPEAAA
jgi:lipoyl(octanoyl) transferase